MSQSQIERITKMLGGPKILGRRIATVSDLIDRVREGLPVASLEAVSRSVGLTTQEERTEAFHISGRTLQRRSKPGARLDPIESERVVRLARIARLAEDVLEDTANAHRWLREPNAALNGKRPFELLDTDLGARLVEDVLGRLEYSTYG